jgi:hypothetical protein
LGKRDRVMFGNPLLNEFCCECGQSVKPGSGRFANRVPECNSIAERAEMGRPFPEGDFVCGDCDCITSDD